MEVIITMVRLTIVLFTALVLLATLVLMLPAILLYLCTPKPKYICLNSPITRP